MTNQRFSVAAAAIAHLEECHKNFLPLMLKKPEMKGFLCVEGWCRRDSSLVGPGRWLCGGVRHKWRQPSCILRRLRCFWSLTSSSGVPKNGEGPKICDLWVKEELLDQLWLVMLGSNTPNLASKCVKMLLGSLENGNSFSPWN